MMGEEESSDGASTRFALLIVTLNLLMWRSSEDQNYRDMAQPFHRMLIVIQPLVADMGTVVAVAV
jgi:hypothetical protein